MVRNGSKTNFGMALMFSDLIPIRNFHKSNNQERNIFIAYGNVYKLASMTIY